MVYTITLNTAIDEVIEVASSIKHEHNLIENKITSVGGKAIKTSILLSSYEISNVALGFVGGENAHVLSQLLKDRKVVNDFVYSSTYATRKTTVIVDKSTSGSTMYVEKATNVSKRDIDAFHDKLSSIKHGSIVVLAGSRVEGVNVDALRNIIKELKKKNCYIVCDLSAENLQVAIEENVDFIKPNESEFNQLFGCKPTIENCKKHLKECKSFAVTLGAKGVIYKVDETVKKYKIDDQFSVEFKVRSTTGCGDMFIAGYVYGLTTHNDPIKCAMIHAMAKSLSSGSDVVVHSYISKVKKYLRG